MTVSAQQRVAELAARDRFGRIVGYLAARFGTLSEAEDALSLALVAALEKWPEDGVPDNPTAWLLAVARRRLTDMARRGQTRQRAEEHLTTLAEERADLMMETPDFPDERLRLMVACADPGIPRSVQAPLMLQTILGFDAATIASAFLVSPAAMGQRLARAKRKIRTAGIRLDVGRDDLSPQRLAGVLDAVYACFTSGWVAESSTSADITTEAIWLARLMTQQRPTDPEPLGLLALLLFAHARRDARIDSLGRYVPLDEQDTLRWHHDEIAEAEQLLGRAATLRTPGRFQIEAAIQSAHCDRHRTGVTEWRMLGRLYDALMRVAPSIGSAVSRSAAWMMAAQLDAAEAQLDALDPADVKTYAPYWVVSAELARRREDHAKAIGCYAVAIGLTINPAERAYLETRRSTCLQ